VRGAPPSGGELLGELAVSGLSLAQAELLKAAAGVSAYPRGNTPSACAAAARNSRE